MSSSALVVGGSNGVGLGIVTELLRQGKNQIYIADKQPPSFNECISYIKFDASCEDFSMFDKLDNIDTLIITCGFGRICPFEDLSVSEISRLVKVNELTAIQILHKYINKIKSKANFYCAVMVSISGHIVSPLYSVYSAAKSGLAKFIENLNAELAAEGYTNRILDCSPGYIKGTSFYGEKTDLKSVETISKSILQKMKNKDTIFIPDYENVYERVFEEYRANPAEFALSSYEYKKKNVRGSCQPGERIGFLSGTFDLFHIGHLNLLKRAREQCDYLIVSVHKSAAWKGKETFIPYEERREIIKSIRYVDQVAEDFAEDSDAWEKYHFNCLFVGSDYKGSERFKRYEEFFKDKNVEIIYFPYTQGTSSTKIRKKLTLE